MTEPLNCTNEIWRRKYIPPLPESLPGPFMSFLGSRPSLRSKSSTPVSQNNYSLHYKWNMHRTNCNFNTAKCVWNKIKCLNDIFKRWRWNPHKVTRQNDNEDKCKRCPCDHNVLWYWGIRHTPYFDRKI